MAVSSRLIRFSQTLVSGRIGPSYRPLCTSVEVGGGGKKKPDGSTKFCWYGKLKTKFSSIWADSFSVAKEFTHGRRRSDGVKKGNSEVLTAEAKLEELKATVILAKSLENGATTIQILVPGFKADADVVVKVKNKVVLVSMKATPGTLDSGRYFTVFDAMKIPGKIKNHSVSDGVLTLNFGLESK